METRGNKSRYSKQWKPKETMETKGGTTETRVKN